MSNNTLTKKDIAGEVATIAGLSQAAAERAIDATLGCVIEALADGQRVQFRQFGTFEVTEKAERQGRNPRTGEPVTIPAHRAAKFKPAKGLLPAA